MSLINELIINWDADLKYLFLFYLEDHDKAEGRGNHLAVYLCLWCSTATPKLLNQFE